MTNLEVGSVSAKLELDASDFNEAVKEAKSALKQLSDSLKNSSFKSSISEWKEFAKELKNTSTNSKNIKSDLNNLKQSLDSQSQSTKTAQTNLKQLSKGYVEAKNNINAMAKALNKQISAAQGFAKARNSLNQLTKSHNLGLSQDISTKSYNEAKNTLNTIAKSMSAAQTASKGYSQALNDLNTIARNLELNKVTQEMNRQTSAARALASANNFLKQSYYDYRKSLPTNYNEYMNYVNNQRALTRSTVGAAGGSGYSNYISEVAKNGGLVEATKGYNQAISSLNLLTRNLNSSKAALAQFNTFANNSSKASNNLGVSFESVRGKGSGLTGALSGLKSSLSSLRWITLNVASDFATRYVYSIVNATGETIKNRSEMKSMFTQMQLTRGEINSFNKALDETVSTYKKMNKYSLGETVASLGVEFNLNTQEMKKAMPIVSMVQSEYIRAGRTAEEASLAVKDVLQGEFQRLSRETGVGADELKANGWNGNNKDLVSLLTALEKIGKSRHWDTFAQKATSINDVITITTNRITEMISELEAYVSPVVTGIFNSILSAIDGFNSWFGNLDGVGKLLTSFTGLSTVLATVGTALAMYRTKLGLAQLAQLGLRQSILATIFGIEAEQIATFKSMGVQNAATKAIVQKITGFDDEAVAALSAKRALAAYALGLDANIVKEYGFKTALIGSKLGILDNEAALLKVKNAGLKWHQTLAVLTKGVDVAEAKNMSFAQSLKAIITSMAVVKVVAFTAVILGLAVAFGSVWNKCEQAKKAVEGFEDVVTNGQEYIDSANNTVSYYEGLKRSAQQHVENAKNAKEEADANKYLASVNKELETAYDNVADAQEAYNKAKSIKQDIANKKSQIDIQNQQRLAEIYRANGNSADEAKTKASNLLSTVNSGAYYLYKGLEAYQDRTKSGYEHMAKHSEELKKMGVSQEALNKYTEDYGAVIQDAAYKWKQFEEGDIWAGVGAVWDELVAWWIDFSNNPEFVKFAEEVGKAWGNLQPVFSQLSGVLQAFGNVLVVVLQYGARFVSWLTQSQVGGYVFIGVIGLIISKLAGLGSKSKVAIDALKKIGENAKSLYDKLKKLCTDGGILDVLKEKLGNLRNRGSSSDSSDDDVSIDVDTSDDSTSKKDKKKKKKKDKNKKKKKDKKKTESPTDVGDDVGLKQGIIDDLKSQARFAVKAATGIAIAMALATEAVLLLQAPLWALGQTGNFFKSNEASIRSGGEALQFISNLLMSTIPLVIAFAITLVACNRSNIISMTQYAVKAAMGIAIGIGLVSEAIVLLNVPLLALASVGMVFSASEDQIRQGAEVLQLIINILTENIPLIVAFAATVILSNTLLKGNMWSVFKNSAVGIAIGIGLVSEAIVLLNVPLLALASVGMVFSASEDQIRQGAEVLQLIINILTENIPLIVAFAATVILSNTLLKGNMWSVFKNSAVGIALGIGLVSEAIIGLTVPLLALTGLGWVYSSLGSANISNGTKAMQICSDALNSLVPFVPVFIAGVVLAALAFSGIGAIGIAVAAAGVAIGLGVLAEAIVGMAMPLWSLSTIGSLFPDLGAIQQGANAIRVVGEALTIIGNAMIPLLTVLTADFVSRLTTGGQGISSYINGLTGENGVVTSMTNFAQKLNEMEIPQVDGSKATQIQAIATSITNINSAVQSVQSAVGASTGVSVGGVVSGVASLIPGGSIVSGVAGLISGASGYSSSLGSKLSQLENMVKDIFKFNTNISKLTSSGTADISGATSMVTAISNAIKSISSALDSAISTASQKGMNIGTAIKTGIGAGMTGISTVISTQLANGFNYGGVNAQNHGQTMGNNAKTGFTNGFKIKEATDSELRGALQVMENRKQEFYNKGYQLGQAASSGYLKGNDINSPGIMWRATITEVAGISNALSNTTSVYNSAKGLAEAVVSGYTPTMTTLANNTMNNLNNLNVLGNNMGVVGIDPMLNQPALQQFQDDAMVANGLSQNVATTTQTAFTGLDANMNNTFTNMGRKLQTTFQGINTNTTKSYTTMGNTTRVQLTNMKNQTTSNINAIKNSWTGMQNALISSAEYIRSQTGAKINQLESNMGSFWRKVQNPTLLMGSAGDLSNTSRRPISNPAKTSVVKTLNSSSPRIRIPSTSFGAGSYSKSTGISNKYKPRMKNDDIDVLSEYIACLSSGSPCYAGGWNFNWTDDIRQALLTWRTNFGEIYDPYLTVGKFENDDFPVRGIPEICKGYIYDAISRTSYEGYFNSKTGGDPIAAYSSGTFNCYDGALIIMALARAFGFSSYMQHGYWGSTPHVWAHVDGIGDIDATAIQNGYGFTSPKVSGIGTRGSLKSEDSVIDKSLHLTLNIDMKGANVSDESIGDKIGDIVVDKIIDITGVNKNTGR